MSGSLAAGLLLGLASAGALGGGFALQHRGAAALPPLSLRRPLRSLGVLFREPRWLAGSVLGLSGWAAYIAALRLAPLSLVQAASAGGIVVLALAGGRTSSPRAGRRCGGARRARLARALPRRRERSGWGRAGARRSSLWLGGSASRRPSSPGPGAARIAPGAGLGVAAGILYAAGDVATKEAVAGGTHLFFVPAVLAASGLRSSRSSSLSSGAAASRRPGSRRCGRTRCRSSPGRSSSRSRSRPGRPASPASARSASSSPPGRCSPARRGRPRRLPCRSPRRLL